MKVGESPLRLFSLADVLPPPTPSQVKAHLRLGVVLRWLAIAMVGVAGMLSPRVPPLLPALLAAGSIYNAAIWAAGSWAPARWHHRITLVVTVLDQLLLFSFLPIYGVVVPGGEAVGGYMIGVIEAIGYFGAQGAALSVGIFLLCTLTLQMADPALFQRTFNSTGVAGAVLMIALLSAILVAAIRIIVVRVEEVEPAGPMVAKQAGEPHDAPVRLTKREQEVLRLVAEGYSNTMIASRLHLSDNTVKSYVENLLIRLNVRNRAEAVAAASRLRLL